MTNLRLFYEGRPIGESHRWQQLAHILTLEDCGLSLIDGMVMEVSIPPHRYRTTGVVQSHEGGTTTIRLDQALSLRLDEQC